MRTPTALPAAIPDEALTHRGGSDLQGYWKGVLEMKGTKLRIDLKVAKLPNGEFSASLDSPDQGAKGIPATRVSHNPPQLRLDRSALGASYQGTLENSKLTGNWQQGPVRMPLEFVRRKP